MHVSLGHNSVKWCLYLQVRLCLRYRLKGLLGGTYIVLLSLELGSIRIQGLLSDEEVVAGHDAGGCRRGLEVLVSPLIRCDLRLRGSQLGLSRLKFRLRLRPLRGQFRSFELSDELSCFDV